MIDIDRNAWHYQFINKYSDMSAPGDLCRYVRKICSLSLFLTAVGVVIGFIGMNLLASWWALICYYILGIPDFDGLFGEPLAVIILMFQVCVLMIWAGVVIGKRIKKWWRNRPEHVPEPPSIFKLWLMAKKDKICPMLTFSQH